MDDAGGGTVRWDTGRSRWHRRVRADATIVAANGPAMLVRVSLHPDLHVGSRVDVELAGGRGTVEIRHVAPTGDGGGVALVGAEFVATDQALAAHLTRLALESDGGREPNRWWWQRGS
jgi:hypothetical protein